MATFEGKQILPLIRLVQKDDGVDFDRVRDILDNKTGKRIIYDKSNVAQATKQYSFKCLTREQCLEFIEFFKIAKGRQMSFFVPSFFQDIRATGVFAAGVNKVEIEGTLYADCYLSNSLKDKRPYIAVLSNGTLNCLKVISSVADYNAGTETLTLSSALTSTITKSSYMCQLDVCRFAEDTLVINALNQHMFDISFNLVTCLN